MKNAIIILIAIFSTALASAQPSLMSDDCKDDRFEYAVQIASTSSPELFVLQPGYKEVLDRFETEKVCLPDGKVTYRILIPAEDLAEAQILHSYYRRTVYRDAFIVVFKNGKRIN